MKKFLYLLTAFFMIISVTAFVGCDVFEQSEGGESQRPQIDNFVDLNLFTPTEDDDNAYIANETYYTSTAIDLVTEVNGNYTIDRPFTLDKNNEKLRIYHNIYFYEEDFFQIIYYKNINDLGEIYAVMSDSTDQEYAEVEYTNKGTPLQINIKKQGVYDLILDIETFAIDMVKVDDIETPVYETVKSCELYIHLSASNFSYTEMTLNNETNEYFVEAEIPLRASIGFFSASHMGRYKFTVEPNIKDTLVYCDGFKNETSAYVNVGGRYKVYFNAKTYVVRLELQNPDTAQYFCQVGWDNDHELVAVSSATPYLFEYEFIAQGKVNDPYVDIPKFYPSLGMSYKLSIIDEDGFVAYDSYITESGTYKLTINLKDFTLTIKKLA